MEEIEEKVRKIYQKNEIQVDDEYIRNKIKDKDKVEQIIRLYKQEEIESMNYIFGKPIQNNQFTKFELEAVQLIDLFDRNVLNICKVIWENRENEEKLEKFLKILNKEEACNE